jgi:hypothetical protein
MNSCVAVRACRAHGVALVTVLLLLLAMTVLAIAGIATATVELQAAGNAQYLERAFEASEHGVGRAIAVTDLSTALTPGTPARPHCAGNCALPVTGDAYDYSVYYDDGALGTPYADGGHSIGTGIESHYFVIEAVGRSGRGAQSEHVQGFVQPGPGDD